MIIAAILGFIATGAGIVFCALRADKQPPVLSETDRDEDKIIEQMDREKRAELLKAGGTIK